MRIQSKWIGLGVCLILLSSLQAQERIIISSSGEPVQLEAGDLKVINVETRSLTPGAPSQQAKPAEQPKKPDDGKKPPDGKKDDGKEKGPDNDTVKRPTEPPQPGDRTQLNVKPVDGLVNFSFRGQPWPEVLQWLADISNLNLQWEEAPAGYVDYTTRRPYTVEQVRDQINAILLTKGFTLLRNGEVLIVTSTSKDKLDVSLVPRVTLRELDDRGRYELVRTIVDLDWLLAEQIAEEIKPMLSKHGTVAALKTTNRLDIMDTAGNLIRIRDFIEEEQSDRGQDRLVQVFELKHTRAADVHQMLNSLLGIKSSAPLTPQQAAQQAAMLQQQRNQGKKTPAPAKAQPKIHLAVDRSKNAIMANAPPDAMKTIEQAISIIDQRKEQSSGGLLANLTRTRAYRLSGIDPQIIVNVLNDVGELDPRTRLEVDSNSRSLIANAPLADHLTIQALVEKLDGSPRRFEVIPLRRLDAQTVATAIGSLMKGKQNNRSSIDIWSMRGRSRSQDSSEFQIQADTERNQLWIYGNDVELAQINELLEKLNESPGQRSLSTVRVIPTNPGNEAEVLKRLKTLIPTITPNPIEVDAELEQKVNSPEQPAENDQVRPPSSVPTEAKTSPPVSQATPDAPGVVRLANYAAELIGHPEQAPQAAGIGDEIPLEGVPANQLPLGGQPAPIHIGIGPEGLYVSSRDTRVLDQIDELIHAIMPPRRQRKILFLKYVDALDMEFLLKDAFESADGSTDPEDIYRAGWYGIPISNGNKDELKLKFISDLSTNSILVQGATPSQFAEIEWLIQQYDRIEPPDSASLRRTEMIPLQYAKAQDVSAVIKEVFRDLLSPNDKEMQKNQKQQGNRPSFGFMFGGFGSGGDSGSVGGRKFKSPLSLGVHQGTNTLIVSATKDLLEGIKLMAEHLDEKARPRQNVVRVLKVPAHFNGQQLEALAPKPKRPAQQPQPSKQPQKPRTPEGEVLQVRF